MNIAFISYEYPIETGGGGIGTYLATVVPALITKGLSVIVLAGTKKEEAFWENSYVFRIPCEGINDFNNKILPYFEKLHQQNRFDIIEATDYKGWGLSIKKKYPTIPLVVKLHTPSYLVSILHHRPLNIIQKIRFSFGAFKRLTLPKFPKVDVKNYLDEVDILQLADSYHSPSKSIANKLKDLGLLKITTPIEVFPYPIQIDNRILKIIPKPHIENAEIVFLGRMEVRKGVIELAKAVPLILKKYPQTKFTFVGNAAASPKKGIDMITYLKKLLSPYLTSVTFTGKIPHTEIPKYLDKGDIFVFPSHYESFGIVCTEAMLAGKAVVGSHHGGMEEILDYGNCGLLTDGTPKDIYQKVFTLIENENLGIQLGEKARKRILEHYAESVINQQIENYSKLLEDKINKTHNSI